MVSRFLGRAPRRLATAAAIAGFLTLGLALCRAETGKIERLDTSLRLVPAGAAFYQSMLRGGEQVQAIGKSRAWQKLVNLPVVQMGLNLYRMQAADPESGPGKFQNALDNSQVQRGLAMLGDMFSHEVFVYGDSGFVDTASLIQQVIGAARTGQYQPMFAQLAAGHRVHPDNELPARLMLATLLKKSDLVKVPNLIIGFKLTDTKRAVEMLAQLELLVSIVCDSNPHTRGHWKRTPLGKYEYLVLSLDGSMVPWDQVPVDELRRFETKTGDVDKLVERLKKLTLSISLGLRDDYLLLAIGPSTAALAHLGEGPHLAGCSQLKPLEKYADKRLTSIGYLSAALNAQINNSRGQIDDLFKAFDEALPGLPLKPEQIKQIRADVAALAKDIRALIPDVGAAMEFSFLTDRGAESYGYQWGQYPNLDGSKPLGLLSHFGGTPLLGIVARAKPAPAQYDDLVKWLRVGHRYFEEYALPKMSSADRDQYKKFFDLARPLLVRLDKANRTMLLPALADGQIGFVLDDKLQSKQFIKKLPPTEKPMPMVEPALVLGVSNAQLLRQACGEYWAVAEGLLDAARHADPEHSIPADFKLPKPTVTKSKMGEIAGWTVPAQCGVDKAIFPNAGLSDQAAVLTLSRSHTERLLSSAPWKVGGLLASPNRPLVLAAGCDWAGFVEAAKPWVDLGARKVMAEKLDQSDPDAAKVQAAAVLGQVHTVLEVLQVLRTITTEGYFEGAALVSHTLVEYRDVK
jgi:hypothetical protein